MNKKFLFSLSLTIISAMSLAQSTTPTGIALDQEWKVKLHDFALKNVKHQSWGYSHAERDYQKTLELAQKEKVDIDTDVLFAAAFLHDLGGLKEFEVEGVDHGVRSAELAVDILKSVGFPADKIEAVQTVIRSHIYYGSIPSDTLSKLFREADILDFLGTMGIARIFGASAELSSEPNLKTPVQVLNKFIEKMPGELKTQSAVKESEAKIKLMKDYLQRLNQESCEGKAL